jgi:predicted ester cyclase
MASALENIQMRNKDLVTRHWEELWNQGLLDRVDTFYAANFSNLGRPTALDHMTRIVAAWRTAFPDLHCTVEVQLAEGDQVFSQCTVSGTQRGRLPLGGWSTFPPTGAHFAATQMHRFRLRDGRIVEHWAARDDLAMLQQLGHVSPAGPASVVTTPGAP